MSNKLIRAKTRKPNIWDKLKGSFNCIGFMIESLYKKDFGNCKFGYTLLRETIAGRFEVVVKEKWYEYYIKLITKFYLSTSFDR